MLALGDDQRPMAEVTLAAADVRIGHHDKTANLRRFLDLIDEAGAVGADILVPPEMGLQRYADFAFGRGDPGSDYYCASMNLCAQANAFFNRMRLVVSNHCETTAYSTGVDYWGHSQIVDPHGNVVAAAGQVEGLVLHTGDLAAEVLRARTESFLGVNLLADHRPQHYGTVSDRACYMRGAWATVRAAGRDGAGETFEQVTGSRELLMQFGVENTRRVRAGTPRLNVGRH
jgi:hypothetical protein